MRAEAAYYCYHGDQQRSRLRQPKDRNNDNSNSSMHQYIHACLHCEGQREAACGGRDAGAGGGGLERRTYWSTCDQQTWSKWRSGTEYRGSSYCTLFGGGRELRRMHGLAQIRRHHNWGISLLTEQRTSLVRRSQERKGKSARLGASKFDTCVHTNAV